MLFNQIQKILSILILHHRLSQFPDAFRIYPAVEIRNLLKTCDLQPLAFLNHLHKRRSLRQRIIMASMDHENVHVVDTRNLSTGGGLVVLAAAEMAERGMEAAEIAAACRTLVSRVDASFVIDDLEFLHKGGRCSALAALGANLLQLKPCITVQDGKMGVSKKYRGKFGVVLEKYVEERIGDGTDVVCDHVFVTHAGCDEDVVKAILTQVKTLLPDANVHLTRAGCTVSAHCGKNTLGVLFLRKGE